MRASWRARVTCQSSRILRVRVGRRWVQVLEYGAAGPVALWGLHQAVDAVARQAVWHKAGAAIRPGQTAAAFARALIGRLAAFRRRLRLKTLRLDAGAASWAKADAQRLLQPHRRGTIFRRLTHPLHARVVSCGHARPRDAFVGMTGDRLSPFRDGAYRRLGLGAVWDPTQSTWCVVAVLGR